MKSPHETADIIKKLSKAKGISITTLLADCEINKNALFTMQTRGNYPRADTLIKIADYDCSVDYLLGRTDIPEIQSSEVNSTESEVIKNLRRLNSEGRKKLLDNSIDLVASGRYNSKDSYAVKIAAYGGENLATREPIKPKGTF